MSNSNQRQGLVFRQHLCEHACFNLQKGIQQCNLSCSTPAVFDIVCYPLTSNLSNTGNYLRVPQNSSHSHPGREQKKTLETKWRNVTISLGQNGRTATTWMINQSSYFFFFNCAYFSSFRLKYRPFTTLTEMRSRYTQQFLCA